MARGLKPGQTNNPKGRPKGTANKVTSNLREAVNAFLDKNWSTIERDLKKLEPKDRLAFIEKMLSYSLPKLQSTTIEANVQAEVNAKLDKMDTGELMQLIDAIINKNEKDSD